MILQRSNRTNHAVRTITTSAPLQKMAQKASKKPAAFYKHLLAVTLAGFMAMPLLPSALAKPATQQTTEHNATKNKPRATAKQKTKTATKPVTKTVAKKTTEKKTTEKKTTEKRTAEKKAERKQTVKQLTAASKPASRKPASSKKPGKVAQHKSSAPKATHKRKTYKATAGKPGHNTSAGTNKSLAQRYSATDPLQVALSDKEKTDFYYPAHQPYATSQHYSPHRAEKQTERVRKAKEVAMNKLMRQLGKPYHWGGTSPATGFDCSGLVYFAYKDLVNFPLPRTADQMYHLRDAAPVARNELKTGDLVFFRTENRGTADHVGVYIGNGKFIQSPRSGEHVKIASIDEQYWQRHYVGARRIVTVKTVSH